MAAEILLDKVTISTPDMGRIGDWQVPEAPLSTAVWWETPQSKAGAARASEVLHCPAEALGY